MKNNKSSKIKTRLFTLANILIAYLAIRLFMATSGGILLTILTVVFCASVLLYLKSKAIELSRTHVVYLIYVLLLAISIALQDNKMLQSVNIWMLALSLNYWLLVVVGARKNKQLDSHIFYDFLDGLFIRPVKFSKKKEIAGKKSSFLTIKTNNILKIFLGLVIAFPLLIFVLILLISADAIFEQMISVIFSFKFGNIWQDLVILLVAMPLGTYLALLVNKNIKAKRIEHRQIKPIADSMLVFLTILSIFILLYALFIVASIFSCLSLLTPNGNTEVVVAVARNGFFQLLVVTLINVMIFWFVKLFGENTKQIRLALTLIGIETLGIIVSALIKMLFYILNYGLTILRFNTSVFMLILFVCVMIFTFSLWRTFNYTRLTVGVVAFCLLGLSFNNSGNMIANYNYQRYCTGKIDDFDVSILNKVGVEAVSTALEIYQKTDDDNLKNKIKMYLSQSQHAISKQKSMITLQRMTAAKKIDDVLD
ncbi:hypothetical protein Hs30E_14990 [Lactococcus hodotermopsidis]|uniref:Uncharacterized protein n=1 Tax=Pseudolactococcus hodotermopsidis TaxID=2709157 RepID=A0A6A0BF30_9LACT|nr:DUF4173 domain-containing protein [Lactococcus hodotermopsidis]GFH42948.1 hypothetical protein Hs30E_14990 [Lactococcus hodotermopsidis]